MESAILRTVLYADIFDYPLTLHELYLYLIGRKAESVAEIAELLATSQRLREALCQRDGYVVLHHRANLVETRRQREAHAARLMREARRYGQWLSKLPFVRMVAVTGAVAMANPTHEHDDIDYMLIVQPGRVWLARALAVALVHLARMHGVELCPNYVLAADRLPQTRTDLYVAHELAQMLPLYGYDQYRALIAANAWMNEFLPNCTAHTCTTEDMPSRVKAIAEALLSGRLGALLDGLEYRRRARRFQRQASSTGAALISPQAVKGHFCDHGQRILEAYHQRLEQYNVAPH